MRRRIALFVTLISLALLIEVTSVREVSANPFPSSLDGIMDIAIQSPPNVINYSYSSNLVVFNANAIDTFYLSNDRQNNSQYYSGDFFYVMDGRDPTFNGQRITNVQMSTNNSRHIFSG